MALEGSETHQNLLDVFARESQANRRYHWFADQADVEGQPDAATLFRTIADTEAGHAHDALEFLIDVGDPLSGEPMGDAVDNLRAAIASERNDAETRYTGYAATARAEGHDDIADWLEALARSEQTQLDRFTAMLDQLEG